MAAAFVLYQYPRCSTCRKARAWLEAQEIEHRSVDLVATPPSASELRRIRELAGVELRKLFNTSGQSYRAGEWKQRIADIDEAEAFAALAADGKLIKRPILVGDKLALIGFREADWQAALAG